VEPLMEKVSRCVDAYFKGFKGGRFTGFMV
jgi:hypothetical protein